MLDRRESTGTARVSWLVRRIHGWSWQAVDFLTVDEYDFIAYLFDRRPLRPFSLSIFLFSSSTHRRSFSKSYVRFNFLCCHCLCLTPSMTQCIRNSPGD